MHGVFPQTWPSLGVAVTVQALSRLHPPLTTSTTWPKATESQGSSFTSQMLNTINSEEKLNQWQRIKEGHLESPGNPESMWIKAGLRNQIAWCWSPKAPETRACPCPWQTSVTPFIKWTVYRACVEFPTRWKESGVVSSRTHSQLCSNN